MNWLIYGWMDLVLAFGSLFVLGIGIYLATKVDKDYWMMVVLILFIMGIMFLAWRGRGG